MSRQPTTIGSVIDYSVNRATVHTDTPLTREVKRQLTPISLPLSDQRVSSPIALTSEQSLVVSKQLAGMDFITMSAQDIARIGGDAEFALTRTLDGFLSGMDRIRNPELFQLFELLQNRVDDQRLPHIAEQLLSHSPHEASHWINIFRSKKRRQEIAHAAHEELTRVVQKATNSLVDLMNSMEAKMRAEQSRLSTEIDRIGELSLAYRERFNDFVIAAALAFAFLDKAQAEIAQIETSTDPNNLTQVTYLDELRDKFQGLQSRALALEGTLSRLPADQLVLRQLRNVGIDTLREISTTAVSRANSIKMTLITLGQALLMKGVQALAEQGTTLDRQLSDVRSQVLQGIVSTGANAPGDNRLAQAKQIQEIVETTARIMNIVHQAKEANRQKFDEARRIFAEARQQMMSQSPKIPH